ncbi:Pycsar system effector family protein [Flavilitoribacter nigricans]|uniref:Pycsar effector protein domain-containing protein n=1 Tax=Flavilitoribacter nigricans (strain ATCC 23147 / DSM 23189 / NBRC 102662 / NCIMB 1420 / SS-2) TaxID=1122177 RepID=A0A2D0NHQ1_FLAN2|nr:Pycsar system effector family protein [Flavilitoribacter nigricans]PHN08032.1 hypothetical protein CRP01_03180 [Flavilitoribacter nigricans DSM 23189 = NBRC 102662]
MEISEANTSKSLPVSPLVEQARQYAWEMFEQHRVPRLVFHSFHFTSDLVDTVTLLSEKSAAPEAERELAQVAAWLLPTGYLINYQDPIHASEQQARTFLRQQNVEHYPEAPLAELIGRVMRKQKPQTLAEQLLSDAYQIVTFIDQYESRHGLIRLEQELMLQRRHNRLEWSQLELQELLGVRLYTPYARMHYEGQLAEHILGRKQRIEKLSRRESLELIANEGTAVPFQGLEGGDTARAIQTFFRANYRNHINLSAIADNKANIMISVNSILISVLITFLSYRNIGENNPAILLPVVIFIVSGAASLIFAVLSARPKVTTLNHKGQPAQDTQKNIVFFGNFVHLDLDQYESAMDAIFRSDELMYGNLTRDLYYLGKVLDQKYRYLSVSYTIFMIGFVTTVLTFLIVLFS